MRWAFWKKNQPTGNEPRVGQFGENSKYRKSWQCPQTEVVEYDRRHNLFVVRSGEYATIVIGEPPSAGWEISTAMSLIEGAAVAWKSPQPALFGDGYIDGTCHVYEYHLTPCSRNVLALRATGFEWTDLANKNALKFNVDDDEILRARQTLDKERSRVTEERARRCQEFEEGTRSWLDLPRVSGSDS